MWHTFNMTYIHYDVHLMWRAFYVTYIKCDVDSMRLTSDVTCIKCDVHSMWRTFNVTYMQCDIHRFDVHSMWRTFNVTCIQCNVHSMWRAFNVTYTQCDGHGNAVCWIKVDQVALLPVVVARTASNVPPLGREHQQWSSGTGTASTRKKVSSVIPSSNPQTRGPMLAFLKGTCRLVSGLHGRFSLI